MTEDGMERPLRVRRVVANIEAQDPAIAQMFYGEVFGLFCLPDFGWITTFGHAGDQTVRVSFANRGSSGTAVPGLTIGVDDLGETQRRCENAGFPIVYGPVLEPWGIGRFFVRDPLGTLVNIAVQEPPSAPDIAPTRNRATSPAQRRHTTHGRADERSQSEQVTRTDG